MLERLVAVLQQAAEVARELGVVAPQQALARLLLHIARVVAAGAGVNVVGIIHRQVVRRQQFGALRLRVEIRSSARSSSVGSLPWRIVRPTSAIICCCSV